MTTRLFPAVFSSAEGGYTVQFVDLPDVFTDGETLEEAYDNAKDVLQAMLDTKQEHGDAIPSPTPLADAVQAHSGIVQAIEGQVESGRTIKLSITMDEELVRMIDFKAGTRGRSKFLATGARLLLKGA